MDVRPTRNLDKFIGTKDRFAILKFNRARGNVVVSRRALLEKERDTLAEVLKIIEEGVILEGTVKNITGYGAFVDLGVSMESCTSATCLGADQSPFRACAGGRENKSVVLKFDAEKERISLV